MPLPGESRSCPQCGHERPPEGRCVKCKNATSLRYKHKVRGEVYDAYGNACACCNEKNPLFFTMDHVGNDGGVHRREGGGTGHDLHRRIKAEGFPDRYQILCFNCNFGKARNGGTCPHQEES
jgi:hypothetical protein